MPTVRGANSVQPKRTRDSGYSFHWRFNQDVAGAGFRSGSVASKRSERVERRRGDCIARVLHTGILQHLVVHSLNDEVQFPLLECSIECSRKNQLDCTTSFSRSFANVCNHPRMVRPFESQWIALRQARMAVAWRRRAKSGKPRVPPDPQFLPAHRNSYFRASPEDTGATRAPEAAPNLALPLCDCESELDSPRLAKKEMGAGAICFDI